MGGHLAVFFAVILALVGGIAGLANGHISREGFGFLLFVLCGVQAFAVGHLVGRGPERAEETDLMEDTEGK